RLFCFQAEDGIRGFHVTGVQTCALPISLRRAEHTPHPPTAQFLLDDVAFGVEAWCGRRRGHYTGRAPFPVRPLFPRRHDEIVPPPPEGVKHATWHRYSILVLGGRFSIQEMTLLAGGACTSGCPRIQAQIVRCELPIPSRNSGDPARSVWRPHGLESPHPS